MIARLRTRATAGTGRHTARTFDETHYSPLTGYQRVDDRPRSDLHGASISSRSSVLSTPLAVDGVIYLAVGYSVVHAVDAQHRQAAVALRPAT